ncbi:hypothetical protein NQF87_05100 [Bombella sp. TMW 2.2559]|uniref:Lipoprotein n=1 Tax=Bombella dulcis TaxID=2967339 RepID=A0ABT3WBN5_9PROT|nr:hypothetical protein [Bombella dulcis]MCX5616351.1 hypothetical protein [Bombella dulcis]
MCDRYIVSYLAACTLIAACIAGMLSGCSSAQVRYACPPLVQYSHEEQAVLASELRAHPELIEVPVFLTDYGNERAECRALDEKR